MRASAPLAAAVILSSCPALAQESRPLPAPLPGPSYTGETTVNSGALLGVGVAMTIVGTVGTIVGVAVAGNAERTDPCYSGPCPDVELGLRAGGLVLTFGSLGLLGAGIPMIAVGARQVPEVLGTGEARLFVGPSGARVTW